MERNDEFPGSEGNENGRFDHCETAGARLQLSDEPCNQIVDLLASDEPAE